jgi:hypothetical protein
VIAREDVHHLLDELPDDLLPHVARQLEVLRDDPLARLLLTAPLDDEPESEAERVAVQGHATRPHAENCIPRRGQARVSAVSDSARQHTARTAATAPLSAL